MVLENIFNPFKVKNKPIEMFFAGFLFTIVGLGLSYVVFREYTGLLALFLIVIACIPLLYKIIVDEEELNLKGFNEFKILKEHSKIVVSLMFLFFGISAAMFLAYVFLPNTISSIIFSLQEDAIVQVNTNLQGNVVSSSFFLKVFTNNIKVLFFCLVFSFLYGTGALFILAWNASVLSVAIGSLFKEKLSAIASVVGFLGVAHYFSSFSFSFLRYMLHGSLEIVSYFVGGLAGGIISVAFVQHKLKNDKILTDVLDLLLISIGLLFVAAIIEVFVTPLFFY